jgi:prepilin-type N-terminal cleavage/methylation domain-containing protein
LRRQFNKIIKKHKWFFNIFLTISINMITKPKNKLDNNVKMLSKKAFTLIEILVVIAMIMILIIWLSKIDLSKWQDTQKSLAFAQKIQNPIETTITNSLVGKWIWTNLEVPSAWKIEVSKANSGTILTSYTTWTTRIDYDKITADKLYEIADIKCYAIWDTTWTSIWTATWSIYITWSQIWTNCWLWQIIEINTLYKKLYPHKIKLNSVSGIVEKD